MIVCVVFAAGAPAFAISSLYLVHYFLFATPCMSRQFISELKPRRFEIEPVAFPFIVVCSSPVTLRRRCGWLILRRMLQLADVLKITRYALSVIDQ